MPSSSPFHPFSQSKHFSPCQSSHRLLHLFSFSSLSLLFSLVSPPSLCFHLYCSFFLPITVYLCASPFFLTPPPLPSPSLLYTARPASPLSTTLSASYVGYLRGDQACAGFFSFYSHSPHFSLASFTAFLLFSPLFTFFPCFSVHASCYQFAPPPPPPEKKNLPPSLFKPPSLTGWLCIQTV